MRRMKTVRQFGADYDSLNPNLDYSDPFMAVVEAEKREARLRSMCAEREEERLQEHHLRALSSRIFKVERMLESGKPASIAFLRRFVENCSKLPELRSFARVLHNKESTEHMTPAREEVLSKIAAIADAYETSAVSKGGEDGTVAD